MGKAKVAIIGTGNIGADLLVKVQRSEFLECTLFTGRNPDSPGIEFAKGMGVNVSYESIQAIEDDPDCCDIVFDATSARAHLYHAPILEKLGKFTVDLTPAHVGVMCIPAINMEECLEHQNVNTITCGGQAAVPIAHAISRVHPDVSYFELVASISSKSAGAGTRANIDEFTQTTRLALSEFTGVKKTKAIIILNPARPPVIMRNTIRAQLENPRMDELKLEIEKMVEKIAAYVPGYRVVVGPLYENGRLTTVIEVEGLGDYLPKYSGNLDIITCASVDIAEAYTKRNG